MCRRVSLRSPIRKRPIWPSPSWSLFRGVPSISTLYTKPHYPPLKSRVPSRVESTARRIARVGCRAMPTRRGRGTLCRPQVGRDPRARGFAGMRLEGEIPGAEKPAPVR
eukprot:4053103-Prymnesium_polylepis.3